MKGAGKIPYRPLRRPSEDAQNGQKRRAHKFVAVLGFTGVRCPACTECLEASSTVHWHGPIEQHVDNLPEHLLMNGGHTA
jgi:hypothetical protein